MSDAIRDETGYAPDRPARPPDPDDRPILVTRRDRPSPEATFALTEDSFDAAIDRWERITGWPAPAPAVVNEGSGPRPAPTFVEWLMGLSAGWVTDPALGLAYAQQLTTLGNGVLPRQAVAALEHLLARHIHCGVGDRSQPSRGSLTRRCIRRRVPRSTPDRTMSAAVRYGMPPETAAGLSISVVNRSAAVSASSSPRTSTVTMRAGTQGSRSR